MSHHSVIATASATANRVKPPPRAITAAIPATIQNAAMTQYAAATAWWVPRAPLILVCHMSASLGVWVTA